MRYGSLNWCVRGFALAVLAWPIHAQMPRFRHDRFQGRQAYVLENGLIKVSLLRGGGHLAEIRFLEGGADRTVNPMRVPHYETVEPFEFDDATHGPLYGTGFLGRFLAGYMGHLLCLPEFGGLPGASIADWKLAGVAEGQSAAALGYEADIPGFQLRVHRRVTLAARAPVAWIEESVENLAEFGRPIHWVQHATFGPPFAEPGNNYMDISAARWAGRRRGAGLTDKPVSWPSRLNEKEELEDGRRFQPAPASTSYHAFLFQRERSYSYFTMYNAGLRVLIGYVFPAADNPWLVDWQENRSYKQKPWDGKAVARGIEFGTTPFDEGLRRSLDRGRHLDTPVHRWIGARQRLTTRYLVFLAGIPTGFEGVRDIEVKEGVIEVQPRGASRGIRIEIGGSPF